MTLAQAKARLRAVGVSLRFDDGEYIVKYKTGTYFTNDREDAVITGEMMAGARSVNPPDRTEKWVPVQTFGKHVDAILYQHTNGKRFRHDFTTQVEMIAVESVNGMDQAVLLRPVGRHPIWKDFL